MKRVARQSKIRFGIVGIVAGAVLSCPLFAADVVFTVNGTTTQKSIPVMDSSLMTFDDNGDLLATCEKDDTQSEATCVNMGTSGSGKSASVSNLSAVGHSGGNITIAPSDPLTLTLNWAVGNDPKFCIGSAVTDATGVAPWGASSLITGTSASFSLSNSSSQNKTYTWTVQCFNDDGSAGMETLTATVEPRAVVGESCNLSKDAVSIPDPQLRAMFEPDGYTRNVVSWRQAMTDIATTPGDYPDSTPAKYPVGSWTLRSQSTKTPQIRNQYLSIPFVPEANKSRSLGWIQAIPYAPNPTLGYKPHGASGVYVSVSPCAGDFRFTTSSTRMQGDETFTSSCRKFQESEATIRITDIGLNPGSGHCAVIPGQTYYLNIIFEDPNDMAIQSGQDTCDPAHVNYIPGVCEAMFDLQ